jgi:DNA-binding NarL/FixJ family response regulator
MIEAEFVDNKLKLSLLMVTSPLSGVDDLLAKLSESYSVELLTDTSDRHSIDEIDVPDLILCHQNVIEKTPSLLADLKQQFNDSRILIIGPSRPITTQITALKSGARGYFDENLSFERLQEALDVIHKGEVWVERHVISGLIDEITEIPTVSKEQQAALDSLSPKEYEVAQQVSYGAN